MIPLGAAWARKEELALGLELARVLDRKRTLEPRLLVPRDVSGDVPVDVLVDVIGEGRESQKRGEPWRRWLSRLLTWLAWLILGDTLFMNTVGLLPAGAIEQILVRVLP